MEKSIFGQIDGTYRKEGNYLLPNLSVSKRVSVGVWGQRHLRYLKQNRNELYTAMLLSGKLNRYLSEIDQQAEEMIFRLINQMAQREGVSEQLKEENQMEWVGRMNSIRASAMEIVNKETSMRKFEATLNRCATTTLQRSRESAYIQKLGSTRSKENAVSGCW